MSDLLDADVCALMERNKKNAIRLVEGWRNEKSIFEDSSERFLEQMERNIPKGKDGLSGGIKRASFLDKPVSEEDKKKMDEFATEISVPTTAFKKFLSDNGYNGYSWKIGQNNEKIVFNEKQIKSASGNNGDFNYKKSNIYKSLIPVGIGTTLLNNGKK